MASGNIITEAWRESNAMGMSPIRGWRRRYLIFPPFRVGGRLYRIRRGEAEPKEGRFGSCQKIIGVDCFYYIDNRIDT